MTRPKILILFCLIFFFHGLAMADTGHEPGQFHTVTSPKLYFTINGYVHHFNRTDRWNEGLNNNIIGFEYEFNDSSSVELTKFVNSFKNPSLAINYNHRWIYPDQNYLSLKFGAVCGYRGRCGNVNSIDFFIFPTYVTKWDSYQIDVHLLPSLYVAFFKVRF